MFPRWLTLILGVIAVASMERADAQTGLLLTTRHNGNLLSDAYVRCYRYTGTWDYYMVGMTTLPPYYWTARFAAENQDPPRHIIPSSYYYKFYGYKNIGGTTYYSKWSKTMYYQYDTSVDYDTLDLDYLNPPPDDMK